MSRSSEFGSLRPVTVDSPVRHLHSHLRAWHSEGEPITFRDYSIHVHRRVGGVPELLFLHGFPTSSYDWRFILTRDRQHAAVAFDFLGFGFSDKPKEHAYSLMWQADLAEEVIRLHAEERPVFIVAHDMGTSVATELMARDLEGRLEMELAGALLFNGSMVMDQANPTSMQKLLRSRLGPLATRFAGERRFRHQFGTLFSRAHPLGAEEAQDQWSLVSFNDGHRILNKLVTYMDEREEYAERWHGAIREWPKHLAFAWGMEDPVATPAVLGSLRQLRPQAPVEELSGVGHYPQIEHPETLDAALRKAVAAAL